jgi:hypothetical protein
MVQHFYIRPQMEGAKVCSLKPCVSASAKKLMLEVLEAHRKELDERIDYREYEVDPWHPAETSEDLKLTEDLIRELEAMPECG